MKWRITGMAGLIGAAALVAGCSQEASSTGVVTGASEATGIVTESESITVTHAFGETVIESEPKRIVALGATATDAVLALGGTLVGAAASPVSATGISPWQEDLLDPASTTLLQMDQVGGYDYEQILSLDPDLVLAQEAGNAEAIYDELGDVVPVIPFHENAFGDSWQTVTRDVATILGEEEVGDELVASVESASDAPDGLDGRTWLFLAAPAPGLVNVINNENDPMSQFFARYGMKISPEVLALEDNVQNPGTAVVSEENYGVLDADLVIVAAGSDEASSQLLGSPTFSVVPAVVDGRTWVTDMTVAMALRSPTVLAVPWVADQLQPKLETVADR
ncbi:iron complex transport system substrate-binding protein [Rhodococcus sp. SMB37]|uniref:ABC transporter substrate-binding protein n=1 Tax=Rhodococcus sp. SMB37 TaxID=2512213 RepID=UPI0006CFA184|nr:ABC transporter substrate-binding protein [Rhodococcus sp. SMB37]TCN45143.1 iron complex transport system substrate-binding protein [Rhodococcus sp. SMB37]